MHSNVCTYEIESVAEPTRLNSVSSPFSSHTASGLPLQTLSLRTCAYQWLLKDAALFHRLMKLLADHNPPLRSLELPQQPIRGDDDELSAAIEQIPRFSQLKHLDMGQQVVGAKLFEVLLRLLRSNKLYLETINLINIP